MRDSSGISLELSGIASQQAQTIKMSLSGISMQKYEKSAEIIFHGISTDASKSKSKLNYQII